MRSSTRARSVLAWLAFIAAIALVLRPALTITIVYDDFYNPIRLRELLGTNPWHIVVETFREQNRNGHFNYVGQTLGALLYVAWDALMAAGLRLTVFYAVTKLVVFTLAIGAGGRLLRTLSALLGRVLTPWRARLAVGIALCATAQLHVPWSYDPVGNFPLWGYLSAAIGLVAADLAVRTLAGTSARSPWVAAAVLCMAILYYEINAAVIAATVPIVVLLVRRVRTDRTAVRSLLRRSGIVVVPAAAMTIVLALWARHTNTGYAGTQTGLGTGGVGSLVKVVGSSLPASSWSAARDFYARPFQLVAWSVVGFVVLATALLVLCRRPAAATASTTSTSTSASTSSTSWSEVALVAAAPLALWLVASLIQGSTVKVAGQTSGFGVVYMYYAYGSLALPIAAIVLCEPLRRARWPVLARPLLLAGALAFVFVQLTINEDVQREFDARNPGISLVLDAYSDQPAEAVRCASLEAFEATAWAGLYPSFPRDLDNAYRAHHGVGFCESLIPP